MTFKDARLAAGLSRQQLAEKSRVKRDMVALCDRGYVPANELVRESLARVLGVRAIDIWPEATR